MRNLRPTCSSSVEQLDYWNIFAVSTSHCRKPPHRYTEIRALEAPSNGESTNCGLPRSVVTSGAPTRPPGTAIANWLNLANDFANAERFVERLYTGSCIAQIAAIADRTKSFRLVPPWTGDWRWHRTCRPQGSEETELIYDQRVEDRLKLKKKSWWWRLIESKANCIKTRFRSWIYYDIAMLISITTYTHFCRLI